MRTELSQAELRDQPTAPTPSLKRTPEAGSLPSKAVIKSRKRGRPARTVSFTRLEFEIAETDCVQMGKIKRDIGARTTADVLRLAVRNLIHVVMYSRKGYEFFAVHKDDPSDKIQLRFVL